MLSRADNARFHSDKEQSQRSAEQTIRLIYDKYEYFVRVASDKEVNAFIQFRTMIRNKEPFTDNQKSYIDVLYETLMKGMGFDYFRTTYKPKRK